MNKLVLLFIVSLMPTSVFAKPSMRQSQVMNGVVNSVGMENAKPRYHCDWTNPKTGQVTTVEGPCVKAKANNGWVTKFD